MKSNPESKKVMEVRSRGHLLLATLLSFLWIVASAVPVFAAEIIVDIAGMDTSMCGTEIAPCRSIAYAVSNRAASGDTVFVHAARYTETITMRPGVIISGTSAASTFIDGEGVRGPMVTASSGVTTSAVLRGFTVRDGVAPNGGGLYIAGTASPLLTDITVTSNTAVRGGGLYIASTASPIIETIEVSANRALGTAVGDGGGGVYVGGSLTLTDIHLISNTASVDGGGLYQGAAAGTITLVRGCLEQNSALGGSASNGGGAYAAGDLVLTGTLVTGNAASRGGGGLFVSYIAVLTNATVLSNTAGQWGGGLYQNFFNDYTQITGGRFESNRTITTTDLSRGGALFSSSRAIISGTQVISNSAFARGGGIYLASPSVLTNVHVISNTAGYGGGVYYTDHISGDYSGAVRVYGGHIERNRAITDDGGGLYSTKSVVLSDTIVLNNTAAEWGGGVYVAYTATLYRPQIISNAAGTGGGLYQYQNGVRVDVIEGIFERNTATLTAGGFYVRGSAALTQTVIFTNTAGWDGGGLLAPNQVLLRDVTVSGNVAGRSCGGLYQSTSTGKATILGGFFDSNVALAPSSTYYGGGGLCIFGEAVITGTQVTRNVSAGSGRGGGGLYAERSVQVVNALFAGNKATNGAGIYLRGTAGSQALMHLTIVSNTVDSGSAVYVYGGTVGVTNTIVASYTVGLRRFGGVVDEDYNLYFGNVTPIQGTVQSGGHSLFGLAPRFVDPAAGDFHIAGESAALDAGSFDPGIATDIDNDPRPTNTAQLDDPDIGFDENRDTTVRRSIADTLTFGAVCARQVFTDTGALTAVTASLAYAYPPDMSGVAISRTYTITPTGTGPVSATLTFCYTDDEAAAASVDESLLTLYRYDGSSWYPYSSTVDMVGNTVTAVGIDAFSMWALAESTPNAVDLHTFVARPTPFGIVLEWETAVEIETLGFNLYRSDGGLQGKRGITEVRLNDSVIFSQAPDSMVGARYQWVDYSARSGLEYTYWLEDVDDRGKLTRHSPASCWLPNAVFRLINPP